MFPVKEKRNEIIDTIKNNDITIITAETGSGKSTLIPQFLYEEGYNVIVTEPRRIAAISLSDYVGKSLNDSKQIVAFHTGLERNDTEDTKILYCTDGLQLAKGIKNDDKTILIIDEVHEWNLNIEFLIA